MGEPGQQLDISALRDHQNKQRNMGVVGPVIVVAGVQDAENLGTIFRIADTLNCREVLCLDVPHAESRRIRSVSRTVSDTLKHRFLTFEAFTAMVDDFPPLIAIELTTASRDVYQCALPQDAAFVVGNERYGMPETVLSLCQQAVHIPMFGVNSSMNVAVALGVVLYEWYRQIAYLD